MKEADVDDSGEKKVKLILMILMKKQLMMIIPVRGKKLIHLKEAKN